MSNTDQLMIEFECGHKSPTLQAPRKRHRLMCPYCQDLKRITRIIGEWSLRCGECRYVRYYGAARVSCETAACKHGQKYNHLVTVACSGHPELTWTTSVSSMESVVWKRDSPSKATQGACPQCKTLDGDDHHPDCTVTFKHDAPF